MDLKLLPSTVVELLERNGALKLDDLYKRTKKRYDGLSQGELEKALMRMEIQGLVRVYRLPRGKKRIELV